MTPSLTTLFGRTLLMRPERLLELNAAMQASVNAGLQPDQENRRGLLWGMGGEPRYAFDYAEGSAAAIWAGMDKKPKKGTPVCAIVPVTGIIAQKESGWMYFFGGTSTDALGATIDALVADPDVKGIVLDVDSPGGTIAGLREVSQKIYDARDKKPLVAVSNSEMNSAAYWVGSSASRVFASPGANTGSIGVWTMAAEYTKALAEEGINVKVIRSEQSPHKVELMPYEEFTAEGLAFEQGEINRICAEFHADVGRNRSVPASKVASDFGQGRSLGSKAALEAGLIDRVATFEWVVARVMSGHLSQSALAAGANALDDPPEPEPVDWQAVNESERMLSRLRRRGAGVR